MEKTIDYTDCFKYENGQNTTEKCSDKIMNKTADEKKDLNCKCMGQFYIEEDWTGKVFMYYELENFYQNHRRYVKSRDDKQLLGTLKSDVPDCKPFDTCKENEGTCKNGNQTLTASSAFLPCGAIANSLFSGK